MPLAHRSQQLKLDTIRPILIFYSHALDSTTGLARLLPLEQPKARILKEYLSSTPPYKKITWMQSWTIVCRWRSVWKAHGAVEHPMISVTEFHCVLWCVDWSGTPVLTSVVFWTSARPACKRCAAPPATSVVSSAVDTSVIVLVLDERSLRRCSVYSLQLVDGAGWSAVEHSVAVVDSG